MSSMKTCPERAAHWRNAWSSRWRGASIYVSAAFLVYMHLNTASTAAINGRAAAKQQLDKRHGHALPQWLQMVEGKVSSAYTTGVEVSRTVDKAASRAAAYIPKTSEALLDSWGVACKHAGGAEIVVGAGSAGGAVGLISGAMLFTGERRVPANIGNNTRALQRLRRGARRRIVACALASAAVCAHLSTLPTMSEGGQGCRGFGASASRRMGYAVTAAWKAFKEPPVKRRPRLRPAVRV
eukprot:144239-Amphidinium_carterae.1